MKFKPGDIYLDTAGYLRIVRSVNKIQNIVYWYGSINSVDLDSDILGVHETTQSVFTEIAGHKISKKVALKLQRMRKSET